MLPLVAMLFRINKFKEEGLCKEVGLYFIFISRYETFTFYAKIYVFVAILIYFYTTGYCCHCHLDDRGKNTIYCLYI